MKLPILVLSAYVLFAGALYGINLEPIRSIPHSGYSEGLDFYEGYLWNALPKEIVKIDPLDGRVVQRFAPASEYSESLVWFDHAIWNVSFSDKGLYRGRLEGDRLVFEKRGTTPQDHAWGITHNGKQLIMTGHFSKKLFFINPKTLKVEREIETKIPDLEDLSWDGEGVWSSSFTAHKGHIFRIDPHSGRNSILLALPNPEDCPVIDGIAYDGKGLWVTGKECPRIWYFKKPSERVLATESSK